jgi:hypothetical protein
LFCGIPEEPDSGDAAGAEVFAGAEVVAGAVDGELGELEELEPQPASARAASTTDPAKSFRNILFFARVIVTSVVIFVAPEARYVPRLGAVRQSHSLSSAS